MNKFKDVSSFSQSDKERISYSFEYRTKNLRICVHRHIHYPDNVWLLSVHGGVLHVDNLVLKESNIKDAQNEGILYTQSLLNTLLVEIDSYEFRYIGLYEYFSK